MRNVFQQLVIFGKSDFEWRTYAWTLAFLTFAISLNYSIRLEGKFIYGSSYKGIVMMRFFAFYLTAWLAVAIPKLYFENRISVLKNPVLWLKILLFLGLVSVTSGFRVSPQWFQDVSDPQLQIYLMKLGSQVKCLLLYTVPFVIMAKVYDSHQVGIYGINGKFGNGKIYLQMLMVITPIIIIASFTPDFIKAYPRFKVWQFENMEALPIWLSTSVFESLYVVDFMMTEWMFRGALVIGMVTVLGKDAILPMVSVYVFLHFGKPLGETISSIFGGYILGVLAYTTRHIWGGVLLHAGIALIMEFMGLFQYYVMGLHR